MFKMFSTFLGKRLDIITASLENKRDVSHLEAPNNLRFIVTDDDTSKIVRIKFDDAPDIVKSGVTVVEWKKTVIVKKNGAYPENPEDGTMVITNKDRGAYSGNVYIMETLNAVSLELGVYYKAWTISKNGKYYSSDKAQFCVDTNTNTYDWDNISALIQSGEAQTFGGLQVGGLLYTPHSAFGCTTTDDTVNKKEGFLTLRIMGFDLEEVDYEGNPNGNPQHSMTVWSEFNLGTKAFCAAENAYALTTDKFFHKEYELELIVTSTGEAVRSTQKVNSSTYIPFFLYDKTQVGYDRIWRSYYGKHKIAFNKTSQKWEVIQISDGQVIYTSKSNVLEPFDDRYASEDNVDITEPENLKWETDGTGKFVILNRNKKYFTKGTDENEAVIYTENTSIVNGTAIPDNTEYYEINPDLNGVRTTSSSTEVAPNQYHRSTHGNNCWEGSPLRQYLNTDKDANTWYHKYTLWSKAPNYANQDGFLKGFTDEKFLSHLATVKNYTERGYTSYGGGYDITYDKVYLPSRSNLELFDDGVNDGFSHGINGEYEVATKDGKYFTYLANIYTPDTEAHGRNNENLNAARKRMNHNNSSFYSAWLRSPGVGGSYVVWYVNASGALYNGNASNANGVAPLLTII